MPPLRDVPYPLSAALADLSPETRGYVYEFLRGHLRCRAEVVWDLVFLVSVERYLLKTYFLFWHFFGPE